MHKLRTLAGPFFVFAGVMHFLKPGTYRRMMPRWFPAPGAMVAASGVAEIAGGAGLMVPATRRVAGWWLAATMVGVFPVHVEMVRHPEHYPRVPGGMRTLWARLPFQAVFIAWVLDASRDEGVATGG